MHIPLLGNIYIYIFIVGTCMYLPYCIQKKNSYIRNVANAKKNDI